ncbi:antitoxin Xre/MbcA/ParS toxin-binding domain-containing protein [Acidisphaera sp. S103]|uniref:antitoxin Xre/MbcA/ParS toxin-binding domain-containing protein n=1 Tax=Acidisphaera sp. S103 TaxID=1747223 RepID=UPI00131AFF8E|nr:antitoxin Xre/MbcA/ParS toxin-binding domain-containing protein [Acidisphaera sp. S103]
MSTQETAELLGIVGPTGTAQSILWLPRQVTLGLPLSSLERVADKVAPDDKGFVYRIVSKATWARRRKGLQVAGRELTQVPHHAGKGALSSDESAKVARLAEVWTLARQVWGSDEAARAFLFRPHPMLEGQRPMDVVLSNEFGRPLVEGILGRLQYGSAA